MLGECLYPNPTGWALRHIAQPQQTAVLMSSTRFHLLTCLGEIAKIFLVFVLT